MGQKLKAFSLKDLPRTPWKNGGGFTREVVCITGQGRSDFDWRVSVASIASSGPFSVFEGVDRIITLLEGDGVVLQTEHAEHALTTPLAPYAFSGDEPMNCIMQGGESTDFNVMSRRGRVRCEVNVIRPSLDSQGGLSVHELSSSLHGVFLVVAGAWSIHANGDFEVRHSQHLLAEQGIWWACYPVEWKLQAMDADAALLHVAIHYL